MKKLYSKESFYAAAAEYLRTHRGEPQCLVAVDIEHFKLFNEWYGTDQGDYFLKEIAIRLKNAESCYGGVAGYFGNDDFYILMPNVKEKIEHLQTYILECFQQYGEDVCFLPVFGAYVVEDYPLSISSMCDRALIAAESIKGNYTRRFAYFKTDMIQKLEEEQRLLSLVQEGLRKGEFTFNLQPQCRISSREVAGAEALVRWNGSFEGMESPAVFIPMLEKNGMITLLDRFVWEEVCKWIRSWLDRGGRPVPISVNVSPVDIYAMDVAEHFVQLTRKYQIPIGYLEVEITESAYVEEFHIVDETVRRLREAGFKVLMDDFGSGYSSLNILKNMNVDILKLDMQFLDLDDGNASKGISILETVINMGRRMGIPIIVEGVRNEEQLRLLAQNGCQYAQGYYFYHPMSAGEFEQILADERLVDYDGIQFKRAQMLHIREFLDENLFTDAMLNTVLGAVAYYDFHDGDVQIIRYNEPYYQLTGGSSVDEKKYRKRPLDCVVVEDRAAFLNLADEAERNRVDGSEMDLRYICHDGSITWLHIHLLFLQSKDGHRLYYGSLRQATELENAKLSEKLLTTLRMAKLNSWEWDLQKNELIVINVCGMNYAGRISEKLQKEKNIFPFSLETMFEKKLIEPEYEEEARAHMTQIFRSRDRDQIDFEVPFHTREGDSLWIHFNGQVRCSQKGRPIRALGFYTNVTEQRRKDAELHMQAERDALTGLYNRHYAIPQIECCIREHTDEMSALVMIDLDRFKSINDTFGHTYGDEILVQMAKQIKNCFRQGDIVCRLGGDEFLVFCRDVREEELECRLHVMLKSLQNTICEEKTEISLSVSAGYVLLNQGAHDFLILYEKADLALLRAKALGKNCFVRYDETM